MKTWPWLQQELAYSRQRGEDALRVTIAACLVLIIGQILKLPQYYWGIITVFVLGQPTVGAVLAKSVLRLGGTILGATLAFITVGVLVQDHVLMFGFMALSFVFLFYHGAGPTIPYTFFIAVITFNVVAASTFSSPYEVEYVAPTRCLEVAVGIAVMTFCSFVFWPHYARHAFRRQLAKTLRQIAQLHAFSWERLRQRRSGLEEFDRQSDLLPAGLHKLPSLLDQTCAEDLGMERRRPLLETQCYRMERLHALSLACRGLLKFHGGPKLHHELEADTHRLIEAITTELQALADDLLAQRPGEASSGLATARDDLEAALQRLRDARRPEAYTPTDNLRSESYLGSLIDTADLLVRMRATFREALRAQRKTHLFKAFGQTFRSLWQATLAPNRLQVETALKGTTIMLFVYVFGQTGYLGDFTATAISAGVIGASGITGAVELKALLRLSGCVLGGVFALFLVLVVFPQITSLGFLVLATAPFFLVCAYLTTGSPQMNYVGFQAGLVISLTALASFAQPLNVDVLFYRLYGILAGMVVAWGVILSFPLRTAHGEVLRHASAFFRTLGQRMRRLDPQIRPDEFRPKYNAPAHRTQLKHLAGITAHNLTARLELEPDALSAAQAAEFVHQLERVEAALLELEAAADTPQLDAKLEPALKAWRQLHDHIAVRADLLAAHLSQPRRGRLDPPSLRPEIDAFDNATRQARDHAGAGSGDTREALNTMALFQRTREVAGRLENVTALMARGFRPMPEGPSANEPTAAGASAPADDR